MGCAFRCSRTASVLPYTLTIVLAAEKGRIGETYLLSGGVQSFRQLFEVWKGASGGPKFMIFLPRTIGAASCAMLEPMQRWLDLPNIFSSEVFTTGSLNWCYSGAKAERELGARFRDPRQAWLDTLEEERQRAKAGQSWRSLG